MIVNRNQSTLQIATENMYKFASALPSDDPRSRSGEAIVFGCARPGYRDRSVRAWLNFIAGQDIQQVCCLLGASQLDRYSNLLEAHRQQFGENQVCWAPIEDFQLCEVLLLSARILPFLATADATGRKVVVHCSGGIGRTGQVLAAWLVYRYHYSNREAIALSIKMGRNPYEAAIFGILRGENIFANIQKLNQILDDCRSITPLRLRDR